ncbi:MAG: hypothetical protein IJU76_00385 [Desulfovibrionaceae bacterium]|nr:hypothetical protein [Desulfovibrionaceae bacterium]
MKHFFLTAQELAARDPATWPAAFRNASHLIYSSPATLSFNSPGAEGIGVKRAALSLPNSVMLLFSPGCCGRNTWALGGNDSDYARRTAYLLLDETDIVTGRYLPKIVLACETLVLSLAKKPEVLVLCSTCVDALLGTDMARLCARVREQTGIPALAATMYALTREGQVPPMVAVRKTIYSLLTKQKKHADTVTLLGFFTHLADSCELYELLQKIGLRHIYELGRMPDMAAYQKMAQANFTLVLHPEARLAAQHFEENLGIPSIELTRTFEVEKVHRQYMALGHILEQPIDDSAYLADTQAHCERVRPLLAKTHFALGETSNAEPFALALALLRLGAHVAEIFASPDPSMRPLIRRIAEISPETNIASNTDPSMLAYRPNQKKVTFAIGRDACFYHPECPGIAFCDEAQPFGYQGIKSLITAIEHAAA